MNDLNALDLEQAVKIIAGSARSMGIRGERLIMRSRDLKNYLRKQKT